MEAMNEVSASRYTNRTKYSENKSYEKYDTDGCGSKASVDGK